MWSPQTIKLLSPPIKPFQTRDRPENVWQMGVELLPWIANRRVCHQRLFNAIKLVHSFCAFDWPFQVSSNLSPVSPVKTEMSTIVLINERAHTRISFAATEAEFRETRVGCSSFFFCSPVAWGTFWRLMSNDRLPFMGFHKTVHFLPWHHLAD